MKIRVASTDCLIATAGDFPGRPVAKESIAGECDGNRKTRNGSFSFLDFGTRKAVSVKIS